MAEQSLKSSHYYDYYASKDLKFGDEYISETAKRIETRSKELQTCINSYVSIMTSVTNEAITAGTTSQALKKFTSLASELKDVIEALGTETDSISKGFVNKVNAADQKFF